VNETGGSMDPITVPWIQSHLLLKIVQTTKASRSLSSQITIRVRKFP
jgi:hypothetical protein